MRLKQRIGDFRVRELLVEGYLQEKGEYRIYRVTKRKITTPEALDVLAAEAGVEVGRIGLAGWKDRQGITVQYMSIPRGRVVRLQSQELLIETEGFASEPFSSEFSRGNAFEINVRNLLGSDLARMRVNLPLIRQFGYVDYFDDQRFGNLVHGQGWIAKELMLGRHEEALRAMIAAPSPRDNDYFRKFKGSLERCWGDWKACRDVAGRYGAHHSVFEALGRDPEDFAGAFTHVSARFRLIHLYAWQSHLWNRAVTQFMRDSLPLEERVLIDCAEGVLVMPAREPSSAILQRASFRLPGECLADVEDPVELTAYEDVLAEEGMVAAQLRIEGVSGFFMKGESRSLMVKPQHLRVRPALDDPLNPGARMVRIRFELPRGSYASLLIKRLFSQGQRSSEERLEAAQADEHARESHASRGYQNRGGHGRGEREYRDREHGSQGTHGQRGRGRDRGSFRDASGERGDWVEGGGRQGAGRGRWDSARSDGRGGQSGGQRGRGEYRDQGQRGHGAARHGREDQFGGRGRGGEYRGRDERPGGGYRGRDERGSGYGRHEHQRGRGDGGGYRGDSYSQGRSDRQGGRDGGYRGHGGGQRDHRSGDRDRDAGYRGQAGGYRDRDDGNRGRDEGNRGRDEGNRGRDEGNRGRDDGYRGRDDGYRGRDDRYRGAGRNRDQGYRQGYQGRGAGDQRGGQGRERDSRGGQRDWQAGPRGGGSQRQHGYRGRDHGGAGQGHGRDRQGAARDDRHGQHDRDHRQDQRDQRDQRDRGDQPRRESHGGPAPGQERPSKRRSKGEDGQSGGYRSSKPKGRRDAPERGDDGWS